jgi:hypothetical protein
MDCRKINGAVVPAYRFARQGCPDVTLRHTQRYRPQAALQKIQMDDVSAAQVENPSCWADSLKAAQAQSLLPVI